ncbi:MAG: TonB family protein [Elusimicrobiota bacterium]|jgi:TonB family protein
MSVVSSLALHAGGVLLYLQLVNMGPKTQIREISNVDLIRIRKVAPAAQPVKPAAPTMRDFLKLALPSMPKIEPRRMEIKLPEIKRPLMPTASKLDDRRRIEQAKIDALDLSRERAGMAKIEAKMETRRATTLAALPRLEEVGARRVRNLPEAIALEERRQEAMALKTIQSVSDTAGRRSVGPAEVLREANPPEQSRLSRGLSAILPAERIDLQPRAALAPPPAVKKIESAAPAPPRRTAEAMAEKKKGVEIEGPLADRRVVSYSVPDFPAWAKQQGMLEAEVAIRFYVDREGSVLPDMRVERTSGYGRLDRLAMDHLRNWKFEPIASNERQWGIITFRFVLE